MPPFKPKPTLHVQLLALNMPRNSVVVPVAGQVVQFTVLLRSLLNVPTGHISHVYNVDM